MTFESKHILNAQVAIRSPCCASAIPKMTIRIAADEARIGKRWFDCAQCHHEQESHDLLQTLEMTFACKKCKKCFRKDAQEFEDSDEYCPHCDNHFVIDAKTPKAALSVESEDVRVDNRMLRDERARQKPLRSIFDPENEADKLG